MNDASREKAQQPRSITAQWAGIVGPPVIWLTQFETKYALAGNVPGSRAHGMIVVAGVVALLLIGVCALLAFREWRLAGASPLDRFARTEKRTRFMGALGLSSSVLFALVVLAQMLAELFIEPGKS